MDEANRADSGRANAEEPDRPDKTKEDPGLKDIWAELQMVARRLANRLFFFSFCNVFCFFFFSFKSETCGF